jgi:ABC-2 type transport system permease protein
MALAVYGAPFAARLKLMLQYREAAFAGVVTQCWWGGLKAMILAGFYGSALAMRGTANAPISLEQAITYVWLAQGLLALTPWGGDPDITAAVRDGSVLHDRLRPVDTYAYWYARCVAWLLGRALPRLLLMLLFAGALLRVLGLGRWAMGGPASSVALAVSLVSLTLGLGVSAATMTIVNTITVATGTDRGANVIVGTLMILLSGNEIPLPLFPDWARTFLGLQPFAGILDTPFRIYMGTLSGGGILEAMSLQAFWIVALVLVGRACLAGAFSRLELNGG